MPSRGRRQPGAKKMRTGVLSAKRKPLTLDDLKDAAQRAQAQAREDTAAADARHAEQQAAKAARLQAIEDQEAAELAAKADRKQQKRMKRAARRARFAAFGRRIFNGARSVVKMAAQPITAVLRKLRGARMARAVLAVGRAARAFG